MMFQTVLPNTANFTPSNLMYRFALNSGYKFTRSPFGEALLVADSRRFAYDHWLIKAKGQDEIRIFVYLKEVQ